MARNDETSAIGGELMHDSLTFASRAIHGCRGEALNVIVTSGHGTQSNHLIETMERSWTWLRQHEAVRASNQTISKNAGGIDPSKAWFSPRAGAIDEFEPDDAAFPDLRSSLDQES